MQRFLSLQSSTCLVSELHHLASVLIRSQHALFAFGHKSLGCGHFVDKALQKSPQHSLAKIVFCTTCWQSALRLASDYHELQHFECGVLSLLYKSSAGRWWWFVLESAISLVALCLTWSTLVPFPVKRFWVVLYSSIISFEK